MSNCISNRLPGELPPPAGVEAIETTIGHIKSKSSLADETGGKAFDSVVTIAGIQTFANIDSLKNFGQQLLDAAKGFKTNIDENIKKSAEDVKTAQSELTKTLEELTAARFNLYTECVSVDALGLISEFICSGECDDNKKIEDFCDKISQNFGDDGCGPNGTLRKQGKNTRDRN
ncbi:MAG: hypothetical protein IPH12_14005 [Saprospirales bacterium]|nr:hypothetical protein [Saprospirales bacterium]